MSSLEIKNNFSSGEVAPDFFARADTTLYANAALMLKNVNLLASGGVARREGLRFVAEAAGSGRLVAFEASNSYILLFLHKKLEVFNEQGLVASLSTPYTLEQLENIQFAQQDLNLIVVHKDVAPMEVHLVEDTNLWSIKYVAFEKSNDNKKSYQPFNLFDDAKGISLTPSAESGEISITASGNVFKEGHAGTRLRLLDGEVEILEVLSGSQVRASVKEGLSNADPCYDWQEQAFSEARGWPISVSFYQDRLVFGGSKSLKSRLWFSKTGYKYNFDLGTSLDDEAIEFNLMSGGQENICTIFSSRHLQVFTSKSEWMVSGSPLTPSSGTVSRQTENGFLKSHYIPVVQVEGASIFISKYGNEIRQFIYVDDDGAYTSADISLAAKHLEFAPVDLAYLAKERRLYIIQKSGEMITLSLNRSEGINAFARFATSGKFLSVVGINNQIYVLTERRKKYFIEVFDASVNLDCAKKITQAEASETFYDLSYLEGAEVDVLVNSSEMHKTQIAAGKLTLASPATNIEIGFSFEHIITPLPHFSRDVIGKKAKVLSASFFIVDALCCEVDLGKGVRNIIPKRFNEMTLGGVAKSYSGHINVKTCALKRDVMAPLWSIKSSFAAPFKLLSTSLFLEFL